MGRESRKATRSLDAVTPIQSYFYSLSKVYIFLASKLLPRFYGNSESLLLTTANNLSKYHRYKDFKPVDSPSCLKPAASGRPCWASLDFASRAMHFWGKCSELVVIVSTFHGAYDIGNNLFKFPIAQCRNVCTYAEYIPLGWGG